MDEPTEAIAASDLARVRAQCSERLWPAKSAGRTYVFTKTASRWTQAAELKGSDTVAGDNFGESVAISGTTAVVGAWLHAKSADSARMGMILAARPRPPMPAFVEPGSI